MKITKEMFSKVSAKYSMQLGGLCDSPVIAILGAAIMTEIEDEIFGDKNEIEISFGELNSKAYLVCAKRIIDMKDGKPLPMMVHIVMSVIVELKTIDEREGNKCSSGNTAKPETELS